MTTVERRLALIGITLLSTLSVLAQDIIILRDSTKIEAVIKEITESEVRYKRFSNQNGPDYVVNTNRISQIRYQNGEVDRFVPVHVEQQQAPTRYEQDWPMTRQNKNYLLYGNVMSQNQFMEELKLCPSAYRYYKKNSYLGDAGAIMIWVGLSIDMAGAILLAKTDKTIGIALSVTGGLLTTAGIPMCCVGYIRRKNVYQVYNRECGNSAYNDINKVIRFDIQASENGVGLAMKF